MIALIPATIVAAVVGKDGINALLIASQFTLSLVLPFVVLPLVWLTSNERIMSVPIHEWPAEAQVAKKCDTTGKSDLTGTVDPEKGIKTLEINQEPPSTLTPVYTSESTESTQTDPAQSAPRMKSFKNGRILTVLGYVIFLCILGADIIAIISLAKGS